MYFLFSIILLIDIFDHSFKKTLTNFLSFNKAEILKNNSNENLYKLSIMNSDGVIFASENIKKSYLDIAANSKIPFLKCGFKDGYEKEYMDFYNDKILN